MTRGPVSVRRPTLAAEALNIMEARNITSIIVVDPDSNQRRRQSCTCTTSGARRCSEPGLELY